MSVMLRGNRLHYRFQMGGKDHSGYCAGCELLPTMKQKEVAALWKRAAKIEEAEKERVRAEIRELEEVKRDIRKNKSVIALVENYRYELTGGRPIPLAEAYPLAAAKPSKRESRSSYIGTRKSYWNDFAAYMAATYPDVADLATVRKSHCEAYIRYLMDNGRFIKEIKYQIPISKRRTREVCYTKNYGLSAKTVKEIAGACRWVFTRLEEEAGIFHNPWENVVLPAQEPVPREVFTEAELRLIWNGIQDNPFCYVLFVVAANSGLTEGDICTLKWSEVDWVEGFIRRSRRKTGVGIELPLLPELAAYFHSLPRRGEYIFPEHAKMYLHQPGSVSARVTRFLTGLGIATTVKVEGRRDVSVKDLHSMRHVFCYRAKRAGIPESVIMKFVGHKVLAMTQHYAAHDTDDELRTEIKKLPALFLGGSGETDDVTVQSNRLAELAAALSDSEVEQLLALRRRPRLPEAL